MAKFELMRGYDYGTHIHEEYASPKTYKTYDEAVNALLSIGRKTIIDLFNKRMHVESERECYDKYYDEKCGYGFNALTIKSEEGGDIFYFIKPVEN